MATSQLVLPRHPVEEFLVSNMPDNMRNRLTEGDGRANIWVVDDEKRLEHYLTMVDRDHRYSIISWSHVRHSRELKEGQEMRFGWMHHKLHFIVITKDNDYSDDSDDDHQENGNKDRQDDEQGVAECIDEPPAKRRRIDMGR